MQSKATHSKAKPSQAKQTKSKAKQSKAKQSKTHMSLNWPLRRVLYANASTYMPNSASELSQARAREHEIAEWTSEQL